MQLFIIIIIFYFIILYCFCHTSTCIHHRCTHVPNPEPPSHLPPHNHPSGSSQCTSPKLPVSCIEPGLVIHFLYDIIHVSMPFSQIIPPSLSHRVQKTVLYICVSLDVQLLSLIQFYLLIFAFVAFVSDVRKENSPRLYCLCFLLGVYVFRSNIQVLNSL